ncbi:hypothetical protein [uncultured Roseobacter sp.]|nr:hypothetical protein [uncultured Roseobacter sp.]
MNAQTSRSDRNEKRPRGRNALTEGDPERLGTGRLVLPDVEERLGGGAA